MIALLAALSLALSTAARLNVPYVSQTPSLCGGAAAAMVFRYWGDRHAVVEPFAALVNRQAGGIATDALVGAIRGRQWTATPFTGTVDRLASEIAAEHPIIVLLEDHSNSYHYVVAVGTDASGVVVHDPSWGPSRHLASGEFLHAWGAANFWSLLVLPNASTPRDDVEASSGGAASGLASSQRTAELASALAPGVAAGSAPQQATDAPPSCDRQLQAAVAEIGRRGLDAADDILAPVRAGCPADAAPVAELAGVRFGQGRYKDAALLAEDATLKDATNQYAWEVLGSSRFMLNDLHSALAAWNRIGKPLIDSVSITGLTRTRYQLVAEELALEPNSLLTVEALRLAERRLEQLPDASHTRVGFVPTADGYAVVDVAIAERATVPHTVIGFAPVALDAAVNREVTLAVPGTEGQGELWSASWRWWENRPKVGLEFAGPRVGVLPGAWRVDASWERQSFAVSEEAVPLRENRLHAGVTLTNWLSHALRYEVTVGGDSWDSARRAASIGGTIERHGNQDHLIASATLEHWVPLFASDSFSRALLTGAFRSSNDAVGLVDTADAGLETVTASAPLSLWPGAGDGHARAPLLRAHPLLIDGIVTGPVFGRHLAFLSDDLILWLPRPQIARVGVATFVDVAHASDRIENAVGDPFQVDAGVGVRLRIAGGTLRLDYAHGLRDGKDAVTVGFNWLP